MKKKSISKQKKQAISKNEEKKWYKDRGEYDDLKTNPALAAVKIGYLIIAAGTTVATIALMYWANKNLQ